MQLPLVIIPKEIIDQYHIDTLARNGIVYLEIQKSMQGLKQAGE